MSLTFNIITIMPLSLICYFVIPTLIERYLPNYANGIEAAKIYALGSAFLVYFGTSIIIPVVRRNTPLIIGYAVAIVLLWLLGWVFVHRGYGITGVAWARLISTGFISLFSLGYSYYLTGLGFCHEKR